MAFLLSGSAIHRLSMGFRTTPVIVRRSQGLSNGSKVRFEEEPPTEVEAERQIPSSDGSSWVQSFNNCFFAESH
nr:hypothetical protein [uncultured Shinella sp.]